MSGKLSISGDDDDWQVFGKTPPNGNEVLFRSRTSNPAVHAFAIGNQMARVRCVLAPDQVAANGMPKSTKDVDDFEDSLLGALQAANAEVCLVAVVTGEGNRDLFFAARDLDDLRLGIKGSTSADTIKLQFAPVGEKEAFLRGLSLSPEQTRAAIEQGRVHEVPAPSAGRFFGKLFKR
jgi:hypothetical protein